MDLFFAFPAPCSYRRGTSAISMTVAPRRTANPTTGRTRLRPNPRRPPPTQAPPEETYTLPSHPVPGFPDWRFAGPPLSAGPLPALVYFALTAEQSLGLPPFNSLPYAILTEHMPTSLRVFSCSLPYHGTMTQNASALKHWASEYAHGNKLVENFAARAAKDISRLVRENYIEQGNVHLAGLSRGAMVAASVAAECDVDINSVLMLAPVTDLAHLPDFGADTDKLTSPLRLDEDVVRALSRTKVRISIGNRDMLVGTRPAFDLVEAVAEEGFKRGVRSPEVELEVYGSVGLHGHGTPPEIFEAGARWVVERVTERT